MSHSVCKAREQKKWMEEREVVMEGTPRGNRAEEGVNIVLYRESGLKIDFSEAAVKRAGTRLGWRCRVLTR